MKNIDKAFEIEQQKSKPERLTKVKIYRNFCPFDYGIGKRPNIDGYECIEDFCQKNHKDCFKDCWDIEFNEEVLFQ
jgi:hypothetical protein